MIIFVKKEDMKKLIILTTLLLSSCYIQEIPTDNNNVNGNGNNPIVNPPPGGGGTTSAPTLIGQKWVIKEYKIGTETTTRTCSDTLHFITKNNYMYSTNQSKTQNTYSFYVTGSGYNLTLNGTVWGNLSGTIYDSNLNGDIRGLPFIDITIGSANNTKYYLWITKI